MKNFLSFSYLLLLLTVPAAQAGVFNIPEFVEYKSWAIGFEPEVTLSAGPASENAGVAGTVKFTYGITPLSNLQLGMGEGSGSKGFRTGGTYTFDFIPDLEGQLGAGLALQAYYFKLKYGVGTTETTLYPYLHKMLTSVTGLTYDPYIAIPFGFAFKHENFRSIWQLVLGSYFKTSPHFGVNAELGLSLKDTDSYVSTGITYRD